MRRYSDLSHDIKGIIFSYLYYTDDASCILLYITQIIAMQNLLICKTCLDKYIMIARKRLIFYIGNRDCTDCFLCGFGKNPLEKTGASCLCRYYEQLTLKELNNDENKIKQWFEKNK